MELAPIMGPEEWAPLLRCTPRTVRDHLNSGFLPGKKFGDDWIMITSAMLRRLDEITWDEMHERRGAKKQPSKRLVKMQEQHLQGRQPPSLQ